MNLSEEDFDLYRLKYALSIYLVRQVILADDVVEPQEIKFVREHFPQSLLQALDLLDTQEISRLIERALHELPHKLSLEAKLDIVGICFAASASDGNVDPREIAIVQVAAEVLAVPSEVLIEFIQQLLQ
jgi:uncharacterized tellurite resistance protein B-like protein